MYVSELWFFRRLGIDTRLPEQALQELKKQGRIERWGHRAKIYQAQDDDDVYVILSGNVFLDDGLSKGPTRLKTGDVYGQNLNRQSHGDDEKKGNNLTAFDETTLCAVSQNAFREITREHIGNVETSLGGWLSSRSIILIPIMPLLCTSPASRFARILIHLAETQGQIEKDRAIFWATLKPAQVGRLIGLDAAHVRVLLMNFIAEGIVVVRGKKVEIPSVELVRSLAVQSV